MIFVKFAIAGLLKVILFLNFSFVQLSLVMRTNKNLYLVTVLISSPSANVYFFHSAHYCSFCRFKFRPTLSLLSLTHFISSIMSSLCSPSTAVSSACVVVFIFHVTFPIPVTISPTPHNFITYSLYILNRPEDKMQPCLTPFWIGNHSVVPQSTYTWLLTLCVGLISTLSNALLFPYFLAVPHFQMLHTIKIHCVIYKTV